METAKQDANVVNEVKVAYVQNKIESLWEMEEPHVHDNLPAFPLKKCDDMYEVGLLWQGPDRPEDNKRQAVSSAVSLRRGLLKKNNLESYKNVLMKEYQGLDAIEKEPEPERPGYYMPHHAVVREAAATTKLRVVFNASASQKGDFSLNDVIEPGPSLLPNLPGLLMRLREYRCAVQADIRKVFFMTSVKEEDCRFLRFVWFTTEGKIEIWRLKKLPFGVNCSPFILNAVICHHLRQEEDACTSESVRQIIRTLLESFYVDDCLTSLPSKKDADVFKETSIALMANAGMELRKWRGNSIASKDNAADKALGICWELPSDELHLPSSSVDLPTQWTRRSLLRTVAALFDPLGLMSPVTITGRILLQCSWKEKQVGMHPSHQTYVGEQKSGNKILLRSTHFQHAVGSGLIQKVCTTYTCSVMHQK